MLIGAFEASKVTMPQNSTLYIKVSESFEATEVKKILDLHKGETPVCIYVEDSATVLKSDKQHGVNLNSELMNKLVEKFGFENIKIR